VVTFIQNFRYKVEMLKPFFNKTGNRFVETSNLRVIGLHEVMCYVAAVLERKAAGEVKRGYVITTSTVCVCVN